MKKLRMRPSHSDRVYTAILSDDLCSLVSHPMNEAYDVIPNDDYGLLSIYFEEGLVEFSFYMDGNPYEIRPQEVVYWDDESVIYNVDDFTIVE